MSILNYELCFDDDVGVIWKEQYFCPLFTCADDEHNGNDDEPTFVDDKLTAPYV